MTTYVQLDAAEEAVVMREAAIIAADALLAEALLTRDEAAAMLRVTTKTLNLLPILRVKLGGATRYRRADLLEHIRKSVER
jgi:hypothetical protein